MLSESDIRYACNKRAKVKSKKHSLDKEEILPKDLHLNALVIKNHCPKDFGLTDYCSECECNCLNCWIVATSHIDESKSDE